MRPLPSQMIAALQVRVLAMLEARAVGLAEVVGQLPGASADIAAASARMKRMEREISSLSDELNLWRLPYRSDMRIHAAWMRHPGAPAVFARHHLPVCDRCVVRFDESIGEAAAAYGLDLEALLGELNALLL